jgi:hypothetical protein
MTHKGSALAWLRLVRVDCKRALGAHNIYSTIARCPWHVRPRNTGGEGVYLPWYSSLAWKKRRSRQPKALAKRLRKLERRLERLEMLAAQRRARKIALLGRLEGLEEGYRERAHSAFLKTDLGWTKEEIDRELAPWPMTEKAS